MDSSSDHNKGSKSLKRGVEADRERSFPVGSCFGLWTSVVFVRATLLQEACDAFPPSCRPVICRDYEECKKSDLPCSLDENIPLHCLRDELRVRSIRPSFE